MNKQQSTWVFRKSMGLEYVSQYGILDMVRNAQQTFCPLSLLLHTFIKKKDQGM